MGTRWIEWCEPFGPNSEPVYCRVSEQTAIAAMKASAKKTGFEYKTDGDALLDFITIHYAEVKTL